MSKDAATIQQELSMPFAPEDLEWRVQVTNKDKTSGLAVPYVTNRAIQERLDAVVGPNGWYNEYRPWHSNGGKDAQICGISIFFEGQGWVTKWDGAEDSDIEPIKGGLSDSMKRAAVQWGIGRVLYKMDTVWVDVETRGRSVAIKPSERAKLNKAYTDTLAKLGLTYAKATGLQAELTPKPDTTVARQSQPSQVAQQPQQKPQADNVTQLPVRQEPEWEYVVAAVNTQQGMSQTTTSLTLQKPDGKSIKAFASGACGDLAPGVTLRAVKLTMKKQGNIAYYVLEGYEVTGKLSQAA